MIQVARALISLSDKTHLDFLANELNGLGIELISTGGTYQTIAENGIPVKKVSEITGFPEILDGRVKTLHPKIHGAILAKRESKHISQMTEHQIEAIDLVIVNLYPFEKTVSKENVLFEEAIENIDIGGPAMIRSAAKNHAYVAVVVDPNDYSHLIELLKSNQNGIEEATSRRWALKAFQHTAAYDSKISDYLCQIESVTFPTQISFSFKKQQDLRYGENPHQQAAFYTDNNHRDISLANSIQLWGKELSYNNIMDLDAALRILLDFSQEENYSCIIKHSNPCGAAIAVSAKAAYIQAVACDPVSYFGGIVGFNCTVDEDCAHELGKSFLECIIAPNFSEAALNHLKEKKNIRLIQFDHSKLQNSRRRVIRQVLGGILLQESDILETRFDEWKSATHCHVTAKQKKAMEFAWKMVKHVKSNAIVLSKGMQLIGVGAGQMSRVDSVKIAIEKAKENGFEFSDVIMASDAFFPFRDAVDLAAKVGIKTIIQPGGSVKDNDVLKACEEHKIELYLTGIRHFNH